MVPLFNCQPGLLLLSKVQGSGLGFMYHNGPSLATYMYEAPICWYACVLHAVSGFREACQQPAVYCCLLAAWCAVTVVLHPSRATL